MTDNLKEFLQKASGDDKLAKEFQELQNESDRDKVIAKTIELAKNTGFSLTEADFKEPEGEVDDEEMEAVSGGWKKCACFLGGGGEADVDGDTCACVAAGAGVTKAVNGKQEGRCLCTFGGYGYDQIT